MATYCGGSQFLFVAGNKGNRLEAAALEAATCPEVDLVGQTEVKKMVQCGCCTFPTSLFCVIFWQLVALPADLDSG